MYEWSLQRSLLLTAGLSMLGKLGDGVAPALLSSSFPLALLALNASDTYCLLTAAASNCWLVWGLIAWVRRVVEDGLHFALGRWHGPAAAKWFGVDLTPMPCVAWPSWAVRTASLLALAALPSLPSCVAAGYSGLSPRAFLFAHGVATVVRLLVMRLLAGPLGVDIWVGQIAEYRATAMALTTVCAVPGALLAAREWRRTLAEKEIDARAHGRESAAASSGGHQRPPSPCGESESAAAGGHPWPCAPCSAEGGASSDALARYEAQLRFHRINLRYPGLRVLHEEPYIFGALESPCESRLESRLTSRLASRLMARPKCSAIPYESRVDTSRRLLSMAIRVCSQRSTASPRRPSVRLCASFCMAARRAGPPRPRLHRSS